MSESHPHVLTLVVLACALAAAPTARGQGTGTTPAIVIGGTGADRAFDSATDTAGNVYLVGETFSPDFPIVGGIQNTRRGTGDAFVTKLSPTGVVLYSTYLGGSGFDSARGVAVGADGSAYVVGYTDSSDFPLASPLDGSRGGASDAFIAKLSPGGNALLFSTYFGGNGTDSAEGVALDAQDRPSVAGRTRGGLPVINAAQATYGGAEDAFVLRLNPALSGYEYVTYLGGTQLDIATAIAVDDTARTCVAGITSSPDFPAVAAPQGTPGGGNDAFYAVLDLAGTLLVSSTLGGSGQDEARGVDCTAGWLAVVGRTTSADFPTGSTDGSPVQSLLGGRGVAPGAPETQDGFLTKLILSPPATGALVQAHSPLMDSGRSLSAPATHQPPSVVLSTYRGGRRDDSLADVIVDATGATTVMGDGVSQWPQAASMHFPGAGLVRTADGGATWTPTALLGTPVNDVAVAATTPVRVLAATDEGLRISTDDGATFGSPSPGLPSRPVNGIAVSPIDPCTWTIGVDALPADGATPVGGARTTDCGRTWDWWPLDPTMTTKRLEYLRPVIRTGNIRLVASVVGQQPSFSGVCVFDTTGVRIRCVLGPGSEPIYAVDSQAACRFYVARDQEVTLVDGAATDCNHPFNIQSVSPGVSAPISTMTVTSAGTVFVGTARGEVKVRDTAGIWTPVSTGLPPTLRVEGITEQGGDVIVYAGGKAVQCGVAPPQFCLPRATGLAGQLRAPSLFVGRTHAGRAFLGSSGYLGLVLDGPAGPRTVRCGASLSGESLDHGGVIAANAEQGCGAAATAIGPGGGSDAVVFGLAGSSSYLAFPDTVSSEGGVFSTGCIATDRFEGASVPPWIKLERRNVLEYAQQAYLWIEENTTGAARTARIVVDNLVAGTRREIQITQAAAGSAPPVAPTTLSFDAQGGEANVSIAAAGGVAWQASSPTPWIVVSPSAGTGPGQAKVTVSTNTGAGRVSTAEIAGRSVVTIQAAAATAVTDTALLAEGATSTFFDTQLGLSNPSPDVPVVATATYDTSTGSRYTQSTVLWPLGRATLSPADVPQLQVAEFSTSIAADGPVVVGRRMTWDGSGYGSHAEGGIAAPSRRWYLAEGATHSGFGLFYLLQNPGATPATVDVRYLRPAPLAPIVKTYVIPPRSRFNIWVNQEGSDLASTDVSAEITSDVPIAVERAMYLSSQGRPFNAGHESAGISAAATEWFLAEGATGPFFDLFALIANPTSDDAPVRLRYLLGDGSVIEKDHVVPANSRYNVWVDHEDPRLADVGVSTTVTSTAGVPIVVERAMWWPGASPTWHGAHNSAGATQAGPRWALGLGEVGGPSAAETYVLIANTSAFAGQARVTLMFEGGLSPVSRIIDLLPTSRTNVPVSLDFPEAANRRFGVLVESLGDTPAQLVVEEAIYANSDGVVWAAGANLQATRLP